MLAYPTSRASAGRPAGRSDPRPPRPLRTLSPCALCLPLSSRHPPRRAFRLGPPKPSAGIALLYERKGRLICAMDSGPALAFLAHMRATNRAARLQLGNPVTVIHRPGRVHYWGVQLAEWGVWLPGLPATCVWCLRRHNLEEGTTREGPAGLRIEGETEAGATGAACMCTSKPCMCTNAPIKPSGTSTERCANTGA